MLYQIKFSLHVFFFFSSRRRHTRCSRDWSSDVCSSDLRVIAEVEFGIHNRALPLADIPLAVRFKGLGRSEEHTSELQSRLHLVCRLLLEKKKKNRKKLATKRSAENQNKLKKNPYW